LVAGLDFCTSPGPDRAKKDGIEPLGKGVTRVITDLGILARSGVGEELQLVAVHPGVTVEQVEEATGWDLRVAPELATIDPPSPTSSGCCVTTWTPSACTCAEAVRLRAPASSQLPRGPGCAGLRVCDC